LTFFVFLYIYIISNFLFNCNIQNKQILGFIFVQLFLKNRLTKCAGGGIIEVRRATSKERPAARRAVK